MSWRIRSKSVLAAAVGDDLELDRTVAVRKFAGEIAGLAVDLDGQGRPGETLTDRRGGIGTGGAVLEGQSATVG